MLESITGLESLRPLLALLGFGDAWLDVQRQHWPDSLLHNGVGRIVAAGERGSLSALAVQLNEINGPALADLTRNLRLQNPAQLRLLVCIDDDAQHLALTSLGLQADSTSALVIDIAAVRSSDLEALEELCGEPDEVGVQLSMRHARALDRTRVTRRFFLDFKTQRAALARSWRGMRGDADERNQLALLFLCRLVFLYFLQKRGHLGSIDYLYDIWKCWRRRKHTQTFFAARLKPLFFGVLNTRPEKRSGGARRFGDLPYLNGGLFELHALERRHRKVDLPDRAVASVFDDLLQRYRFTTVDSAQAPMLEVLDAGVDPEMLGRVFEELMAEEQRGQTGTFFTPPVVVDRLVNTALAVWTEVHGQPPVQITVLDPACGSGAFLLGALARLTPYRGKREVVEHALHGVDLQSDAALLCALRLWLCLLPGPNEKVEPLPNLDRRIRQGDALLDPLDLAFSSTDRADRSRRAALDAEVRAALKRLRPLGARYVTAGPETRGTLRTQVQLEEVRLASAWLRAQRQALEHEARELRARQRDVDLFGEATREAVAAGNQLADVKNRSLRIARLESELRERSALPFFSFPIHFGDTAADGFDVIVSNPPWVRAHKWPEALGKAVRQRFEVCSGAENWSGTQVDLSLLFLERSVRLLKPQGVLALLLPAKTFRSLYAGGARRLMLRDLQVTHLEDHSLDQHSIFTADAFAGAIVACRDRTRELPLHVRCFRKTGPPIEFTLERAQLPLRIEDPASPWLLVPPDVLAVIRKIQCTGQRIRDCKALPIHRGVFTGANDVLLVEDFEPKLGDHAIIRTEGFRRPHGTRRRANYRGLIEESCVRPVVRGTDLRPWSFDVARQMIWCYDRSGRAHDLPSRAQRFVQRHKARLQARTSWRKGMPLATVFTVASHTLSPKVAWRDLAPDLQATALPACIRSHGRQRELIPLNTVYYIATETADTAELLAAYLNSLPLRTFARAIAERAKDAHFRFFSWVIGELPLPHDWQRDRTSKRLQQIATQAHRNKSLTEDVQAELDRLVAQQFGLTDADVSALQGYSDWLSGQ